MSTNDKEKLLVKLSADVTEAEAEQIKALAKFEERTLAGMVRKLMRCGLRALTEGKAKR